MLLGTLGDSSPQTSPGKKAVTSSSIKEKDTRTSKDDFVTMVAECMGRGWDMWCVSRLPPDYLETELDPCCSRDSSWISIKDGPAPRPYISWVTFSPNMDVAKNADGDDWFRLTTSGGYDVALGKSAITNGRWEWVVWVLQPEKSFVGVATFDCSKNSGKDPHKVWDVTASNLELNSENPCRVIDSKDFKDAAFCGD